MQALAIVSGVVALGTSVIGALYYFRHQAVLARLTAAENAARALGVTNQELRAQLESALQGLKSRLDKEAAHDAATARTVTDADSAADFLNAAVVHAAR